MDVIDNPELHRFEARLGDDVAILVYRLDGNTITFTHTEVPPAFRGHHVAEALTRAGLDSARARKLKVVPLCPYVATFVRRHPEYQDLTQPA